MPVEIGERHVRLRGDLLRGNPAAADRIAGRVAKRLQRRAIEGQGDNRTRLRPVRETFDRERSEEHTSELQSLMRISYAVFCLKKKKNKQLQYNDLKQNTQI